MSHDPIPIRIRCPLCTWCSYAPGDPEHGRHFWWCERQRVTDDIEIAAWIAAGRPMCDMPEVAIDNRAARRTWPLSVAALQRAYASAALADPAIAG